MRGIEDRERSVGSEIIPVPAMKKGSMGSEIIPVSDMERAGGGGKREGNVCPPADLPSPPSFPSFHPPNPLQQSHRGRGEVEVRRGVERVTWPTATSQLLERPLGGWTGQYLPSPTTLIKSVADSARSLGG